MKVNIKTLAQKSLTVEIDADKTVYDLKKELSLYPDVGVSPEQQKIIYASKILENDQTLCDCKIDEKKFVVVMILKTPLTTTTSTTESATTEAASAAAPPPEISTPATTTTASTVESPQNKEQDEMVANIVSMGYPESEVRQALDASFNNPERAVEYLIEGIPISPNVAGENLGGGFIADSESEEELPAFELLRTNPVFRNLRSIIQQNPELLDEAVARMGENSSILNIINEHPQEFMEMLFEQSEEEDDDVED